MKSITIFLMICLLIVDIGLARQKELNESIINESGLQFMGKDSPTRGDDVQGATFCKGVLDSCIDELKKIGISKKDLENEVYCTIGDFDGNGYLDFAIWGADKEKNKWPDYENYLVLFFEKSKIIHTIKIKSDYPGRLLLHYPPRKKVGPNGEPVSKNDALWLLGQTGDYDDESKGIVFIFDANSGKFKISIFGKD